MNADVFAEWLKRQGHKIYRTPSSYWYDAAPRVLQAFPFHLLITPDEDEINSLLFRHNIIALRYSAPPDFHEGKLSYHIVQNNCYDLNSLKSKTRNGILCGLKNFKIEEISFDRLSHEGWPLQQDTLIRQKRSGIMNRYEWERICQSARGLSGFKAFGAISGGELSGAMIVSRIDDVYTVPHAVSHCRFLRCHVNNAMFYSVCCELLKTGGINGVFFCVESLDAPADVDEFKLRMGFEPKPVRQIVAIHPVLKPLITTSLYSLLKKLLAHYPSNPYLKKSEGMLRFHLEGRRPVNEQNCPECISDRIKILQSNAQII
jgi:hypothetical protein